ncbi:hypothetical protein [Amycolatopsis sp. CA-128772]|uniref:hypothetical protein n=1 Tax=Amycolatopsis sp. CA-128772 TaxID=2073159 RepID=UPI000CD1F6CA|nr:hypothetical protein [Amycolatopsis sp. CA-128772]
MPTYRVLVRGQFDRPTEKTRTAVNTLCLLVETAADLHGPALADQLRIPCPGPLTVTEGNAITELLRKDEA